MRFLAILLGVFCTLCSYSQNESRFVKFGKITEADLQQKKYSIDTNANAVVLSDIGSGSIEGNTKGWFSIVLRRHKVVHILNKKGYGEADIEIPLYTNGDDEERLESVKATTYNLENGKIVETKLDKSSVLKEKVNKNKNIRKFTMPNIKEGCIIEYEYRINSDYISTLDPWLFQSRTAPQIWSEYEFSVPQFFTYNFLSRGYHGFHISDRKDRVASFAVRDNSGTGQTQDYRFSSGVTDYRWVMKDVPELTEENFTSSVKNHISRIEFQLAYQSSPLQPRSYRSTWEELANNLLESEGFGKNLSANNNWLSDEIKPVYASVSNNLERARKIFYYVRDNFTSTGASGHIYMDQPLKTVWKNKKGSVSEINLLLTAMLRYAGLRSDPVLVSTRGNGYAVDYSPMTSSFNYVVAEFSDNGKYYYLDASDPQLGFNRLNFECYNGHARVINEEAPAINLMADSLKEAKTTLIIITNKPDGKWVGTMTQTPGYYESYHIREKVKEKGQETFFKEVEKDFGNDIKIIDPKIDSLKNYETPIGIKYTVEVNPGDGDIIYINPVFGEGYKKNLFSAAERYYPVEMPYTMDETIVVTMEVPTGYEIDEMPKQMLAKFDEEGNSFFEYRISHSSNVISFRTRIKLARAFFMPEEYESLREFFNLVVSKHNEQIVLKKKK